jgi:hypothetical protein
MRKPITTKAHGILDYLTVGAMLAFPRMFNTSKQFETCLTGTALTKLGWVLLTRHELGLFKVIPMKAHLALDCIGGAAVAALPFALEEDDQDDPATVGFCLGMCATDIIVAALTQTTPSFDQHPGQRQPRELPRSSAPSPQVPASSVSA